MGSSWYQGLVRAIPPAGTRPQPSGWVGSSVGRDWYWITWGPEETYRGGAAAAALKWAVHVGAGVAGGLASSCCPHRRGNQLAGMYQPPAVAEADQFQREGRTRVVGVVISEIDARVLGMISSTRNSSLSGHRTTCWNLRERWPSRHGAIYVSIVGMWSRSTEDSVLNSLVETGSDIGNM
jgi:hypothetical protein